MRILTKLKRFLSWLFGRDVPTYEVENPDYTPYVVRFIEVHLEKYDSLPSKRQIETVENVLENTERYFKERNSL